MVFRSALSLDSKGYTFVELLVVISILIIVTAVALPNYNSYIARQNLTQAQEMLKSGVRDAQNRAMSGVSYEETASGLCRTAAGVSVPCQYWVLYVANGADHYRIGPRYSNGSCFTSSSDSLSEKWAGDVTVRLGGSNACIFYKMHSGNVTALTPTVLLHQSGTCKGVKVNEQGLVKGVAQTCP